MSRHDKNSENLAMRMSVLYDVSLLVNSSNSYKNILSGIVRNFKTLMPLDYSWLMIDGDGFLKCASYLNNNNEVVEGNLHIIENELINGVLNQEIDDRINDLDQYRKMDKKKYFSNDVKSLMICPLTQGDDKIGCLILGAKEKTAYTKDHMILLFMLGLQLATVLKNIRLHNELKNINERLNLIFSNIDEGLLLLNSSYCITDYNLPVDEVFFPDENFNIGENFLNYLLENKKNYKLGNWVSIIKKIEKMKISDFPVSFELIENIDNNPLSMHLEFMPVYQKGQKLRLLVLLRDIRERKKADELRRDLTSMLVHDLRSPLGIINWNMEMILDGVLGDVNDKQKKFLKGSIENSQELLEMVDSLLDIDRLETGSMVMEYEDIDIKELTDDIVMRMEFLSHQMGINFDIDYPDDLPFIAADRSLIRRVFFNLIFNASKYSPKDSKIEIKGEYVEDRDDIVISIKDYGPGIPKKYRKKIFDKYVQAQARHKGKLKSKGLGLTFCKLAVEAHGGHIWIDGEETEGTLFKFSLSRSKT